MKHPLLTFLVSLAVVGGCADDQPLAPSPDAQLAKAARSVEYDVHLFDVELPGAVEPGAYGINARGDVVGLFMDSQAGNRARGFLWSRGEFHQILYPGSVTSAARGINDAGDIVGTWNDGGKTRGFLLHNGEFTVIDRESATMLIPWDISSNGIIVGNWVSGGVRHGFILQDGTFTSFDVPVDGRIATHAMGVDPQGNVTGYYTAPAPLYYGAFIRLSDGTFLTEFDTPEPDVPLWFTDVNPRGDISGGYFSWTESRYIGFIRDKHGAYAIVETPGLAPPHNEAYSINASGVIVGEAWNPVRAYIAVPRHGRGE
jgi:probable HAF family extracellular repeat protein